MSSAEGDCRESAQTDAWVPLGRCPVCRSPDRHYKGQARSLSLFRCSSCSLVYTDPQPRELVARRYLTEYDLAKHFTACATRKDVLFRRRLSHIPPSGGSGSLCDVGCSDGQFLSVATANGWHCVGIELNPPAVKASRARGFEVLEGALEHFVDLPWGTFDVVTCWEVLEHTPSPRTFCERLVQLLRPGGILILATLNANSLVARAFGMRWSMIVEDHFTYWVPRALMRLLVDSGAVVTRSWTEGVGRDFFRLLDNRKSHSTPPSVGDQVGGWDMNPVVLRLESAANRLLQVTGAGVELIAIAQKDTRKKSQ